jgi:hypothetical protein
LRLEKVCFIGCLLFSSGLGDLLCLDMEEKYSWSIINVADENSKLAKKVT